MTTASAIAKRRLRLLRVIFTSLRTEGDNGYAATADKMVEIAATMPGFLGVESARDGLGITVCYWRASQPSPHGRRIPPPGSAEARQRGVVLAFRTRVCKVERD